jgi:hypothetical protein
MTLIKQLKSSTSSLSIGVVHTSRSFLWKPIHTPILHCWTLLTREWMLRFSVSKILFVVVFNDCECVNVQELQNLTLEIWRASIKNFVWIYKLSCQGNVDIQNQFVLERIENWRFRVIRCSNTWMGCVKKSSAFFAYHLSWGRSCFWANKLFFFIIDHQKHDQEPSWNINFHPAKTFHEMKERKESLIWKPFHPKNIHKKIKVWITNFCEN